VAVGGGMGAILIRPLLARDPDREIESVIKITDHDPRRAWIQMDEYVPTETVRRHLLDVLEVLLETRRGAAERVCIWVSGFFGSGKSHFLKVLGYLLEDRELIDPDERRHSSQEFLAHKLGEEFTNLLPHLRGGFKTKVLYINLLDRDPQDPNRPTISRLVYRHLLESQGLSTEFWVARWEQDLRERGKWDEFRKWVQGTYGRAWEKQRELHPEAVLGRALPVLLSELYADDAQAERAIADSKVRFERVEPAQVVEALVEEARRNSEAAGRVVVLLDEVGLYIGDDVDRLTDLNRFAELVVERGQNRILLIATAQEAITDLVPRLTRDQQMLSWLRDRFRLQPQLLPTEVEHVIGQRLLQKTLEGERRVRELFRQNEGALRENLALRTGWIEDQFVQQYPCPPYAVEVVQDVLGAMRGSVEEMRRLSGSERSMLKLVHAILRGEGGVTRGADQPLGWIVGMDLFFDAVKADLAAVRSDQVRALEDIERAGQGGSELSPGRVAKALFLLQQVGDRYPCTPSNLASALTDHVRSDARQRTEQVAGVLQELKLRGWVAETEGGRFRLLTPAEHSLEEEVHRNLPYPSEVKQAATRLLRDMLRDFRYEHGQIRRRLPVTVEIDGDAPTERVPLHVCLFTPLSEIRPEDVRERSIRAPKAIYWVAAASRELGGTLERALALKKSLDQWGHRPSFEGSEGYREHLERECREAFDRRLPDQMRQAFLQGRVFVAGVEASASGASINEVLQHHLRDLARELYTEFIDRLPRRDEDCEEILRWRAGGSLPDIYRELGLVTADQQIVRDAQPLSLVRAELQRQRECLGDALVQAFEAPPFGWDPRLVRLLVATLFKMGMVRIRFQGRQITDAADPGARTVFLRDREFRGAVFELLPEVDWRRASEFVSRVFGVPAPDTFEATAEAVRRQADDWKQRAELVKVRTRDNRLPDAFVRACEEAVRVLTNLAQRADPNERLRYFLECAEALEGRMALVRNLEQFPFEEYRRVREFAQAASGWAGGLQGEATRRWQHLTGGLQAVDLPGRWPDLRNEFAALVGRYREDYTARHREFMTAVEEAVQVLRQHEAFQHSPQQAEEALGGLVARLCTGSGEPGEEYVCPECGRRYEGLVPTLVAAEWDRVERALDALLPSPPRREDIEPLHIDRTIAGEQDVDAVALELRRYLRRARRNVRLTLEARPE